VSIAHPSRSQGDLGDVCAVAVMAKAPRVGDVKTRLVPPLTEAEAAALSACFIRDIAENIVLAAQSVAIRGYVAYSPEGAEAAFDGLLPQGIRLLRSRREGLGRSLADAAEDLLAAGCGGVCLVNSDSPNLPSPLLVEAVRILRTPGDRVVLGPAEDGGYYLIGLKRPHPRLFEEIDWSTERVLAQTLDRACEIGLEPILLPRWYDVDDVASLQRLASELLVGITGGDGHAAPHTTAFLRRIADDDGSRIGIAGSDALSGRASR
jgi:uncharacterized protein